MNPGFGGHVCNHGNHSQHPRGMEHGAGSCLIHTLCEDLTRYRIMYGTKQHTTYTNEVSVCVILNITQEVGINRLITVLQRQTAVTAYL